MTTTTENTTTTGAAVARLAEFDTGRALDSAAALVIEDRRRAEMVTVSNPIEAAAASALLAELVRRERETESDRKAITAPINASVRMINDRYREVSGPIIEAVAIVKGKLVAWEAEQERQRLELQAEMDRQAAERQRVLDEQHAAAVAAAEAQRMAAEAEAAEMARAAARARSERSRVEREAQALTARVAAEAAAAAEDEAREARPIATAAMAVAPVARAGVSSGVSSRMVWQVEIIDPSAIPRRFMVPDPAAIRAAVLAGEHEIPGVLVQRVPEMRVSRRGA